MSDVENPKAGTLFNEVERNSMDPLTWTPEEEKKLVKKIDLFLLPTIWLMYLLSYMVGHRSFLTGDVGMLMANRDQDRTNIGNARIAGMADDLELSSNQYSVCLVVFFVTYV